MRKAKTERDIPATILCKGLKQKGQMSNMIAILPTTTILLQQF